MCVYVFIAYFTFDSGQQGVAQALNMLPQVQNITLPDGQEAIFIPANTAMPSQAIIQPPQQQPVQQAILLPNGQIIQAQTLQQQVCFILAIQTTINNNRPTSLMGRLYRLKLYNLRLVLQWLLAISFGRIRWSLN